VDGQFYLQDGALVDMADGTIGTFTINGLLNAVSGSTVTFKFDLDSTGVDKCIIADVSTSCDIKDVVVFNILSKKLTPGTYPLVELKNKDKSLMENHFGFSFTGDPADHSHIIRTETVNGYTLTLQPNIAASGNWTSESLVITKGG
jgi:hypothetical protein